MASDADHNKQTIKRYILLNPVEQTKQKEKFSRALNQVTNTMKQENGCPIFGMVVCHWLWRRSVNQG